MKKYSIIILIDYIIDSLFSLNLASNVQKDNAPYESGFLLSNPHYPDSQSCIFWEAFRDALKKANKGPNGQMRILSIIATKFTYQELKSKLGVSIQE